MTDARFAELLIAARAKLAPPRRRPASARRALAAAALAAVSALTLASTVILSPALAEKTPGAGAYWTR
jgi:hypothetical protein